VEGRVGAAPPAPLRGRRLELIGTTHATSWASGDAGALYERGRPDYPAAAVAFVAELAGRGPGRLVVDVAAGTGKLTRLLTSTGAQVAAVEPMPGMLAQLRAVVPAVPALAGVAEALPLRSGTAAAVTVAQAFHWFRPFEALAEAARVLSRDGVLALVWNERDESVPWVAEMTAIQDRYERANPRPDMEAWRVAFESDRLFTPLELREFPHRQSLGPGALVERSASTSFALLLPEDARQAMLAEIAALPAGDHLPYVTRVRWCRKR
jgi:SAM-dependent methyltransferase